MDRNDPILLEIDRLIRLSRLREVEFIMSTDVAVRMREVAGTLEQLQPGEYLLGTGPSTVGIIPLNSHEVVLGRPPTVLEAPAEPLVDYYAVDTLYFVPREVSRRHARIIRQITLSGVFHIVVDMDSTCGTFVNEKPVDPKGNGVVLRHGDVISLGPSQTSTYVYYQAGYVDLQREAGSSSSSWVRLPHRDRTD